MKTKCGYHFARPGRPSKAQIAAKRYHQQHSKASAERYDHFHLALPKGYREKLKAAALLADGGSVTAYLRRLIDADMDFRA